MRGRSEFGLTFCGFVLECDFQYDSVVQASEDPELESFIRACEGQQVAIGSHVLLSFGGHFWVVPSHALHLITQHQAASVHAVNSSCDIGTRDPSTTNPKSETLNPKTLRPEPTTLNRKP